MLHKPDNSMDKLLGGGDRRSRKWLWIAVPLAVVLVGLTVHFFVVGGEIADERQAQQAHATELRSATGQAAHVVAAARGRGSNASTGVRAPAAADSAEVQAEEDGDVETAPAEPARLVMGEAGELKGEVASGESLFAQLVGRGFTAAQIQPAINSLSEVFDFKKSRPGHSWRIRYDEATTVKELRYQTSPETFYAATWDAEQKAYKAEKKTVPLEVKEVVLGGTVRSSLYKALLDLGEKHALVGKFIDIFAYDIDFASETKSGDTFRIVFEKVYLEGEMLRYGNVLAAEYKGAKKSLRAYRHPDGGYYDSKGQSLKRMFLRNPVKFSRITSRFGKRKHPILKKYKMHNGVDYAAPRGTPVNAIAGGSIVFAGKKGANGNLVALKHPNGWVSYYAHLSRFARGLDNGDKVRQGQVIGFVGSTGRSTGPHLHLGIKSDKGFIDPLKVHSTRGASLTSKRKGAFVKHVRTMNRRLDKVTVQPPSDGPEEEPALGGDTDAALEEVDDLP